MMGCDLCGGTHVTAKCHFLAKANHKGVIDDSHLAYKSLPLWIQVMQETTGNTSVITHRRLPKYTKLGPLIAPQTPIPASNDGFPLKISHKSGPVSYFDLSEKRYCNWLSLIPKGSAEKRNLVVCQIDDHLFYVTAEDILERKPLQVWYAPFYCKKVMEDMKKHESDDTGNNAVICKDKILTPNCGNRGSSDVEFILSPSLACISVKKSQVMFTHNICNSQDNKQPFHSEGAVSIMEPATSFLDGYIQVPGVSCRYMHKDQIMKTDEFRKTTESKPCSDAEKHNTSPTIELLNCKENQREPEKIITFTINAKSKSQPQSHSISGSYTDMYPDVELESELSQAESSDEDKKEESLSLGGVRKPYKLKSSKTVVTADANIIKQLPPRALGASLPHSWCCRYCNINFSKLLPFAKHIKAHLRWIVARKFRCEDCDRSFPSALLLQNHKLASHKSSEGAEEASSENRSETDVAVKHEILSEEESMDYAENDKFRHDSNKALSVPENYIKGPHNCQICPKQFHKAEYLLRHLCKHTGDYTCKKCLKVFARKEGLQKHLCPRGFHQERFECSLCSHSFCSTELLQKHYLKHKGSRKCTHCGRFFLNITSLERHMKHCPSVEISTSFQCGICSKEFINQSLLDRHMNSHSRHYNCEICNKTYSSNSALREHVRFCRQIQQVVTYGSVKCEECGEVSTSAADFRSHYRKHTHPFNCSGCSHHFRTRIGYEIHVCDVELQCDQCGAEFRSVQALNRHAAVHGPPPFTCMSCRRSYYRKESLDRHSCCFADDIKESRQSKSNSNFKCNVCGVILATRHSYNTHMKAAHGGPAAKEYSCELCGKQFRRKDLLRSHAAVHNPPSYPCPHCKKLFKTQKSLEVHSLLHLGIKRFTCKYCNKKYHQKVNLAKHERSHMPRGAVKCQYCGYQCLSTEDLKAHLLSHTIVQSEPQQKIQREQDIFIDKETIHIDVTQVCNSSEELDLSQKVKPQSNNIKTPLKLLPKKIEDIPREKILSQSSNVIQGKSSLQTSHVEGGEIKDIQDLKRTVVHVSALAKDNVSNQNSVPQSDLVKSSMGFFPQAIHEVCLSSHMDSVKAKSNGKEHQVRSRIVEQDTNFQSKSNTLNSSTICDMEDRVHISDSCDETDGGEPQTYHLNLDDNCQVIMEKDHERFDGITYEHFDDQVVKDDHVTLKCNPPLIGQELVYASSSNESNEKPIKYVFASHQISEDVIIESTHEEDNV